MLSSTPVKTQQGQTVHAYLGIDSGSTTTKFVLIDEDENILDSFYAVCPAKLDHTCRCKSGHGNRQ